MQYRIAIETSAAPVAFTARSDQSVLLAIAQSGIRSAIEVGCRSGGCGVCRVQVIAGEYHVGTMSGAHISDQDRARGFVLACQLFPDSDLAIARVPRTSWTQHLFPRGIPTQASSKLL